MMDRLSTEAYKKPYSLLNIEEYKDIADKHFKGKTFNEEQYNKSLPLIKTQLKALIARDLWDMNEYFQVINTTNNSVQQALKVLNEKIYEKKLPL